MADDIAISGVVYLDNDILVLTIVEDGTFTLKETNDDETYTVYTNDENLTDDVIKTLQMLLHEYDVYIQETDLLVELLLDTDE